ncbi:MAG: peroxidase family protein [Ilumatobacteraceae bacterium]
MSDTKDATTGGWESARDEGIEHLEQGEPDKAAAVLAEAAAGDPSGESEALLGLAKFRGEHYGAAAHHYQQAFEIDGTRSDWDEMRTLSESNAEAAVDVAVPPVHHFDRDELLASPTDPGLPKPPRRKISLSLWKRIRYVVGHAVGSVAGAIFGWLTNLVGKNYKDEVWTNWYRKNLYSGILTLAHMREKLNSDNLKNTYPPGTNIGFVPDGLEPPQGVSHYRTADGSWNNLDNPKEGAAGTRFPRNVANSAITTPTDEELLTPDPRVISLELLTRTSDDTTVPFLNMLAASWIQFQNHDWITHGDNLTNELIEIPLAEGDPARQRFKQTNMFVGRTQPEPTRQDSGETTPLTFINEVTHWWDGSQIYGSDHETQHRLRSHTDGKLRLDNDHTLPEGHGGGEDSGMVRNWWIGLAMLHNLFALEHNAICDQLKDSNPDWDDDRLFNVARLVNAAVMAKIHSVEWTPAILPNRGLDMGLNSNWYGMLTYKFRKDEDRKTVADFNVANPELGGLVGNDINKHGEPYGLTEEFVEVYRLHSLLPEELDLRRAADDSSIRKVPFPESRQAGSPKVTAEVGMNDLFYSFGTQHPGALVPNNFPRFMQELSVPGNPVFDMGAIDILRARERGVPRYNEFRRQLGLNPIRTWDDLTDDEDVRAKIEKIYGDDVESLDLLVGTLAETTRPTNFGFGETMFQIFILNSSRRLQADRFFTDDYREEVYTAEGMKWVDDTRFRDVILRHFPELEKTGLGNIKNAFEPWDTGELDPGRHPLRAYDPELKKDPWKGDAAGSAG